MTPFLHVLTTKTPLSPPPVWLMRQAGRYLPEYRALRGSQADFMTAVLTPDVAAEITLQPLRRFPEIDAAILFSDILVMPYALGQDVTFVKGEGPKLPSLAETWQDLSFDASRLQPMMAALKLIKPQLAPGKNLIGFAGSPWTVACYMVSGANVDDFQAAKLWAFQKDPRLDQIIAQLVDGTAAYLIDQINAGADVVQLFDSWAGLLVGHPASFERLVITPTRAIVDKVKAKHPKTPIIGFPRQAGAFLPVYASQTGVDAVGLDWSVDLAWAHQVLPKDLPVQGNLDPILVVAGGDAMRERVKTIKRALAERPFIFNLGHGVVPPTPVDHVADLLKEVKA